MIESFLNVKIAKRKSTFRVLVQIELRNSSYIVNSFGCLLLKKLLKNFLILRSIYCMKIVQYENISLLLFFFNFSADYILVFILMTYAGVLFSVLYFGIALQSLFPSIMHSYYTKYDSDLIVFFDSFDSLEREREKNERKSAYDFQKARTSKCVGIIFNLWMYPSSRFRLYLFVFVFFPLLFTFRTMNKNTFDFARVFILLMSNKLDSIPV